ncbi:MAG: transcriptional repressor [Gammaproteobacteria bacterium]|nr:transcriptional repressor [Gammaproteobacteria bacterium]
MPQVDARERITTRLVELGIRPTAQRVQIALLILDRPCHFSADQILGTLRRDGASVSKATVYNTLNLFSRHGLVREIAVDPERLMYDSTTNSHHHVYNVETGELFDVSAQELRIGKLPALPRATQAESVEVIVKVRPKPAG